MDSMFVGMGKYQREMVFKFEEFVVTITKGENDKFKINIDPGNYNLYNNYYRVDFTEYNNLKFRIELDNTFVKNGFWYISTGFNTIWGDYFKNGDVFESNKINIILNNIKSSANFIKEHNGTIKNKKINEIYEIGKMKVTLIPTDDSRFKIEIEGMKSEDDVPDEYGFSNPRCYVKSDPAEIYIKNSYNNTLAWESPENMIFTREKSMEIIECLRECSKKLHDLNEEKTKETYSFGKMILEIINVKDDIYTCSIIGMKSYIDMPTKYQNRGIIHCGMFDNNTFNIRKSNNECIRFSQYNSDFDTQYVSVDNFKVTKEEFEELKRLLQICSDNLHRINHPEPEKEKLTIKVTPTEPGKVILEITGMKDYIFDLTDNYRNRYNIESNAILLDNNEYILPKECDNDGMWIFIGKEHPMTQDAAEEIITFLGASAAKLHAKNHVGKAYTLVL